MNFRSLERYKHGRALPIVLLQHHKQTRAQGRIIPAKMLSIRYFAYYIIFGINTGSIMPPPWVRRTWGRIARIWVPKSSSTRAGGLPKLGAPPSPLAGMAQTPATTVAAVAQGTPPTVVPFNQLQPDRDSVCGRTGAPFRACGRSAAHRCAAPQWYWGNTLIRAAAGRVLGILRIILYYYNTRIKYCLSLRASPSGA